MYNTLRRASTSHVRSSLVAVVLASLALSACGGSSSGGGGKEGGTVTIVASAAPDSVDPQVGITGQAREAMWVVNTPLLTFRHANGIAGGDVVPGLATRMPDIADGGRTYILTLREGRAYSDGTPVKASDFEHAIERALRLNWPEASSFTAHISGASEFLAKKAEDISGITTDDASGRITIELKEPFGAFPAILALPAAAPIPGDTPMKPRNTDPPAGDGPYMFESVTPNGGWTLVKNPRFKPLPEVPAGHVDTVKLTVNTNLQAAAQQVLDNEADVFDAHNPVPPLVLEQAKARAKERFAAQPSPNTSFFFLNVSQRPFSSLEARQAVLTAIDQRALARLASGMIEVDCYLTPSTIPGHPDEPCPYHAPDGEPDIAAAKRLVQESGMAGERVTVFSQTNSPRRQYANYLVDVLNGIGFKAAPKLLAPSVYYSTIGNPDTNAQAGYVSWAVSYPDPATMWLAFQASSGPALNYGRVDDERINTTVPRLSAMPLEQAAPEWAELDRYGVEQAYYAAFGHDTPVKFFSDRLDFKAAVFSPMFQNDYTSFRLR